MTDPRELLRSYLRQRGELGEVELVLDRLSAAELQALLGGAPAAPAPRVPAGEPRRESPGASPRREPASTGALERVQVHVRAGAPVPGSAPHPPSPRAPAAYIEAEQIASLPVLADVREIALGCPRCGLAKTRTHVVFGEGRENADVMVVGEAPGQEEDRSGRPFVGRAGRLLDLVLMSSGFARGDVYICNVLKCRPPQNRNPQPDEVSACSPYLLRQVELVQPRVILA
ncbi:MAG TPA: uracil-DNA glycosylase, partial [Longimicrobium sp.]